jgi:hypothetical protein
VAIGVIGAALSRPPEAIDTAMISDIVKQIRRSETLSITPADLRETVKVTGNLKPASQRMSQRRLLARSSRYRPSLARR